MDTKEYPAPSVGEFSSDLGSTPSRDGPAADARKILLIFNPLSINIYIKNEPVD